MSQLGIFVDAKGRGWLSLTGQLEGTGVTTRQSTLGQHLLPKALTPVDMPIGQFASHLLASSCHPDCAFDMGTIELLKKHVPNYLMPQYLNRST